MDLNIYRQKRNERRLATTENKDLMRIYGPKKNVIVGDLGIIRK